MSTRRLHTSLLSSAKRLGFGPTNSGFRGPIALLPPARQASWTTSNSSNQQAHGTFDPSLPFVEYSAPYEPERHLRGNVIVSAHTKAENLTAALAPLLGPLPQAESENFGSRVWHLARTMSAINRFFSFQKDADAITFVAAVKAAADEMDHHPDIIQSHPRPDTYVVISCSTHNPPGLSMRDVRLAKKINELAEPFKHMANSNEEPVAKLFKRRSRFMRAMGARKRETQAVLRSVS